MSAINDGGPAFPNTQDASKWGSWDTGMSLRDYFAAKAMLGIYTMVAGSAHTVSSGQPEQDIALQAYAMADAMLAERAKAEGSKA